MENLQKFTYRSTKTMCKKMQDFNLKNQFYKHGCGTIFMVPHPFLQNSFFFSLIVARAISNTKLRMNVLADAPG